jgi:hypothetical protein
MRLDHDRVKTARQVKREPLANKRGKDESNDNPSMPLLFATSNKYGRDGSSWWPEGEPYS